MLQFVEQRAAEGCLPKASLVAQMLAKLAHQRFLR
jgi:hypothetical protein